MTEIRAELILPDTVIAEAMGEYLNEKIYDYAFRYDVAQVIASSDVLCSDILENMDYASVIEGVTEDIRHNHMDEVAESMVEDFTNSILENTMFIESMHENIDAYILENVKFDEVEALTNRIADLEKSIIDMKVQAVTSKKTFWKGWF